MDAIRATLDAAYIQGLFGFFGALIGAGALILSIRVTARNTLDAHKFEKLAEAKRDSYLELIKSWFNFLLVFNSYQKIKEDIDIKIQMDEFFYNLSLSFRDLTTALHQSSFISEPQTKEKILDFTMKLTEDYFYLIGQAAQYFLIEEERDDISLQLMVFMDEYGFKCLELQKDLRIEIGISEDEAVNLRIMKKQKEFAERIKSKIMKIRNRDFEP
ncbi:hypothetical protein [Acinetobacter sp. Leaf130]|jgi:hypothetical protein|uniref:hypothetical protein n=1 Tax=Acinetobacter sp. Leaf130 TaxID=1736269 RepID=UPI0006F4C271|nr:hypothetical protein [Acinetobacter sp. Leaf130]KQQ76939.1 hypothetical protein ASF86_05385 [Acinetobacter sp. Leaf130]